ncbi:MAG: type III-B CRISPR module RAMP protein Cmr1 [Thermofilaceae archaeon]
MSYADPFEALQNEMRRSDLVCSFEFRAATPLLIGGYDTFTSHGDLGREGLRPLSIKGVWRWWARALVSAAIRRRFGKFPSLEGADRVVAKVLGTTRGRASSSKYQIVVTELGVRTVPLREYGEVARLKLLELGGRRGGISRDIVLGRDSRFRVDLYRQANTSPSEDAFAVASLLLALTFGGVGKATSRGFGKLAPIQLSCDLAEVRGIFNDLKRLGDGGRVLSGTRLQSNLVIEIVKRSMNSCVGLAAPLVENMEGAARYEYPLIETPEEGYYRVLVANRLFNGDLDALQAIGRATLKLYWKALDFVRKGDPPRTAVRRAWSLTGEAYHTWILGLPRGQEPEEGQRTGYWAEMGRRDPKGIRRKSPVIFVPVGIPIGTRYYVIVLGFKTFDWSKAVISRWGPRGREVVSTAPSSVDAAFDQAMDYIRGVLETAWG